MQIKDKVIMVTGGSSGIGLEIARTLHENGAKVLICSKDQAALDTVSRTNPGIATYNCDLAQVEQVRRLIKEVGGQLDIWINNAGLFLQYDLLNPDKPFDHLQTELQVNFVAAAFAITELVSYLAPKKESAIVTITAGMIYTPLVRYPMYNASKSALHSFIVSTRRQLQATSIRMIEIVPPMVATKLTEGMEGKRVSPTVIADTVLHALTGNRDTILVGEAKSLAWMSKLFPRLMLRLLNKPVPLSQATK